jgi:CheY-like chemotaxis protein
MNGKERTGRSTADDGDAVVVLQAPALRNCAAHGLSPFGKDFRSVPAADRRPLRDSTVVEGIIPGLLYSSCLLVDSPSLRVPNTRISAIAQHGILTYSRRISIISDPIFLDKPKMARILIVDDEGGIRSLLARTLSRAGHEVRTAAHGGEAMQLCASEHFDVLLSDVLMPGMNGHELVGWAVRNVPGIRCALMTGFDNVDCQGCPFQSGCRVLAKPFRPKDAVSFIERFLQDLRS